MRLSSRYQGVLSKHLQQQMITNEIRSIEDELALFEKEISSVESHSRTPCTGVTTNVPVSQADVSRTSPNTAISPTLNNIPAHPSVQPSIGPAVRPEPRQFMGPFISSSVITNPVTPTVRPAPPPFLPHVMMRPGFIPQTNLAMRFIPPQLRLPLVGFMRPPVHIPPQPSILESGPSLYEDAVRKDDGKDGEKDGEAGTSSLKTQVLTSDIEAIAQKIHSESTHRSTYIGQVMRGEKRMKRFLRCGGGQVWEDKSLAEWDPNDFRIFCGDLGNEVSDELLAKAFRKYPSFQKLKSFAKLELINRKAMDLFPSNIRMSADLIYLFFKLLCRINLIDFVRACREMDGKYVGNRPIKLRKSNWKERNMDIVKKKRKQKQKLGLA
ncbi:RNA-binding protein 42 [Dirofilaria immitis]|nr:RNA-binding protein 42 [Dirofilaria immitis]